MILDLALHHPDGRVQKDSNESHLMHSWGDSQNVYAVQCFADTIDLKVVWIIWQMVGYNLAT